jgi:hypothetical protein
LIDYGFIFFAAGSAWHSDADSLLASSSGDHVPDDLPVVHVGVLVFIEQ